MVDTQLLNQDKDTFAADEKSEMENSWVLFELDQVQFGIRTEFIREMVLFTEPSKVPDHPQHMRGVINLRGMVIPVIDLRKRLGKSGFLEETENLIETLDAREQDHINWLNELKASVEEGGRFALTTDPHACEFGRWYDNFTTANYQLKMHLKKFDQPHKACHAVAAEIVELLSRDKKEEAAALLHDSWDNKLAVLRKLLDETIRITRESIREIVIIVESKDMRVGFVVDRVLEVTDITPGDIEASPKIKNGVPSRFIQGLAKINEEVKILLSVDELIFGDDVEYAQTVSEV
jgi:purine-binding chemotaxis protein CheW